MFPGKKAQLDVQGLVVEAALKFKDSFEIP